FFDPDRYERWVDRLSLDDLRDFLNRPAVQPSARVFSRIGTSPRIDRASAPSPVSGLIDTGQYDGSNPEVTATPPDGRPAIGLAEFSNANFFSNDTLFAGDIPGPRFLPFPSLQSVRLGPPERLPGIVPKFRTYLLKVRNGETPVPPYRLALAGSLVPYLLSPAGLHNFFFDEKVLQDYAALLLPRAVGYSAALVDYFFRGSITADDVQDPMDARIRTFTVINGST